MADEGLARFIDHWTVEFVRYADHVRATRPPTSETQEH
jgi:hypothetical protein